MCARHSSQTAVKRIFFIVAACCSTAAAQPPTVALTFDDLPAAGTLANSDPEACNGRILAALQKLHAPATGFVNEKTGHDLGAAYPRILEAWKRAGQDLGNHTYSHADLNNLTLAQFEAEVTRGEVSIGRTRYFRFPFNHTGDTREKMTTALTLLRRRGYEIAACTIDNTDYEFTGVYDRMLAAGADTDAARLRKAYLEFTAAEIDYYTGLHRQVFHRDIPHVMLLHLNRLNADVIGDVLDLFVQRGYRFVTLREAQSDAAYRTEITHPTKFGPMWGYRWARELGVKVDGKLEPDVPAWVQNWGR